MEYKDNAIEVRSMSKAFKLSSDKPQTLKERLLRVNHNKTHYKTVLDNIDLNIKKGETVALVGTNGSGKSTLLKLMTKILYPTKGTVETDGKLTSLLELGAGFHPDFSGRENIYFNAAIFGLSRKEIDERIDDIIDFSELKDQIDNPVRTYSSGMYMRLAFSIAINVNAEILLIDEILAVGDQHFQEKCFAKLKELKQSDKTIVIVSHDLNAIKLICDRAIWIYQGEVKDDGDPDRVIDAYLEQIALDHSNKEIIDKKDNFKGKCYLDRPNNKEIIHDSVVIEGYSISDCPNDILKIMLDGEEIVDVERYKRLDVFAVFEDQYGSYKINKEPAFKVEVPVKADNKKHLVEVVLYDNQNNILSSAHATFTVGDK